MSGVDVGSGNNSVGGNESISLMVVVDVVVVVVVAMVRLVVVVYMAEEWVSEWVGGIVVSCCY